jgi:sugar phosphate isomerase/epimerase
MPATPIEVALRHVAALGFDGVEIAVISGYTTELSRLDRAERRRIAGLLRENRLTLSAIAAHSNLLATDVETQAREIGRLKGAVDLAVEWAQGTPPGDGGPVVETTPGGKPEEWEERRQLLAERAAEVAEYAGARGVTIAMEAHIGAIVETPARMLELLEMVGSPYFKANFDISHFDILGMPIEECVAALAPHAAHTHVKDQRGRYPDYEFLIPGEGDFDYVTYLRAMQAAGYEGFITAEVSKMVQRRADYDPLAAATLSYQTLAAAFEEAGVER